MLGVFLVLLMTIIFPVISGVEVSSNRIIYVDDDGEADYTKIQDAIDNASDGYTVFVYNGIYYENLVIDKKLILIGENKNSAIIDGTNGRHVVSFKSNGINLSEFTIRKGRNTGCGIIIKSDNNIITDNIIISNTQSGILLDKSNNNKIEDNIITQNLWYGIQLVNSDSNKIINNEISSNIDSGISLTSKSNDNNISRNIININQFQGIDINSCYRNTICENHISNNKVGIEILASYDNIFSRNNFISNSNGHVDISLYYKNLTNELDNNYWDDWKIKIPRPIIGKIFFSLYIPVLIPWLYFDWNPSNVPYDIQKFQNSFEIIEYDWWPCFQHDPQNIGFSTSDAPDNNEILWWYSGEDRFSSSPAVVDGRVYTGCADSKVYCFDALTGDVIWIYDTNSWWLTSSPAVYDDKVYIGTAGDNIYCLDSETGSKIWDKPLSAGTVSSPVIVDDKLFIGSNGHNVYCLDPENGNTIWSFSTGGMVESSPAVYRGRVYFGSWDDKLYCLDADNGNQIWNYTTGGNVVSSPTVFDDKVYFGSYDDNIYCLDAKMGNLIWNITTGNIIVSSPAIAYDKLYIGGQDSKIYCLDIYDGSIIWNFSTKYGNRFSPVVAEEKVYVGSVDSYLYCLNAETGEKIWDYRISGANDGFGSSAAIVDGRIYIGGHDNKFYCFGSTGGNQPPNKPNKPQGKISGKVKKEYIYSTTTQDIDNDLIWYTWNWGDGTYTELVGPYQSGDICEVSNVWYIEGAYNITVFATDEHGVSSGWSDPLVVSITKNKQYINRPILNFLQNQLVLFPILRQLLLKL